MLGARVFQVSCHAAFKSPNRMQNCACAHGVTSALSADATLLYTGLHTAHARTHAFFLSRPSFARSPSSAMFITLTASCAVGRRKVCSASRGGASPAAPRSRERPRMRASASGGMWYECGMRPLSAPRAGGRADRPSDRRRVRGRRGAFSESWVRRVSCGRAQTTAWLRRHGSLWYSSK